MSDESTTSTQSAVMANATQALAIQDLSGEVSSLRKQIKTLWATVAVIGVAVVALAAFSVFGRMLGVRAFGNGQFPGRNGTFNTQQFNGNGTTGGSTQQTPQTGTGQ
jgi:hypothetical protein